MDNEPKNDCMKCGHEAKDHMNTKGCIKCRCRRTYF